MLFAHQILFPLTEATDTFTVVEIAASVRKILNADSFHLLCFPNERKQEIAKAAPKPLKSLENAKKKNPPLTQDAIEAVKTQLEAMGMHVSVEVVQRKALVEATLAALERLKADLVLLLTPNHARPSVEQETMKRLLRLGGANVLMIPTAVGNDVAFPFPERILVPVDFSGYARAALKVAKELAHSLSHAQLLVLNVATQSGGYLAPQVHNWEYQFAKDRIRMSLFQRLEGFIHDTHGLETQYDLDILFGEPIHQIITTAHRQQIDLIVMSSHGLNGVDRLMMGSVTEGIMRQTTVPLLVVKATDVRSGYANASLLAASA